MRGLWQRFVLALTPAVKVTLAIWTVLFLAGCVMEYFHREEPAAWLMLSNAGVFHGQVWRLVSYALMPGGVMELLTCGVSIVMFGGMLERIWQPRDFIVYCVIAAVGAGLVKLVAQPSGFLLGPSPVAFALMAATGRLFANEPMMIPPSIQLTMRQMVIVMAAISFVLMFFTVGPVNALIRVSGAGIGLLYLSIRTEMGKPREARPVTSSRMKGLEL